MVTSPSLNLAYDRSAFSGRLVVLVSEVEATVYGILATIVVIAARVEVVGRRMFARRMFSGSVV